MFNLGDDQQVPVSISAVDDQGNPAAMPAGATITWASSDPTVATVDQDPNNPANATVVSTGKLGTTSISVSAVLASGAAPLNGTFDVEVVTTAPVGVAITPGTPAPRPVTGGTTGTTTAGAGTGT